MRRLLKLLEHKHTARRMPHHHTSYRGLWVLLVLAGVSLLLVYRSAHAAEYVVTAVVPAKIPAQPAVIDSPNNNSVVHGDNIVVAGSCPVVLPAIVVGIYDGDDVLLGSSICDADGRFSINVHLVHGTNILVPKIFTILHDVGPVGVPITVNYTTSTVLAGPMELKVTLNSPFISYRKNQSMELGVNIQGGSLPYQININWGDNTQNNYTRTKAGDLTFEHTYRQGGTYLIQLVVSDDNHQTVSTSLAAITLIDNTNSVLNGNSAVNGGSEDAAPVNSSAMVGRVVVASYSGTVVAVSLFWFGAYRQKKSWLTVGKRRTKR